MSGWQQVVARFASNAEAHFDRLKYALGTRLGGHDPLQITPYLGYGTGDRIYLKGRVLEDEGIGRAAENDTLWDNLVNMYRRFASDEIPGAQVEARFAGQVRRVRTDAEGFFDLWLAPERRPSSDRLWHELALTLLSPQRGAEPVRAIGRVLVPPPTARFGVISDIDDTVVHTDATSLLKMARVVFLGNARTRLPFPGVAAFYPALQKGLSPSPPQASSEAGGGEGGQARPGHGEGNPIFYVSSSPWNLFDLFVDFFELQGIPLGPLMLRDWGLSEVEILPTGHQAYKLASIRQILDLYPRLPFMLVGDSGQEDPEIYAQIVRDYGERILAVYIRNVSLDNVARPQSIRELADEVRAAGSELLLVDDTLAAARHAAEHGWIDAAVLDEIGGETAKDEAPAVDAALDIVDEDKDRSTLKEPGKADAAGVAR